MPRMFKSTDALRYANRLGLYKGKRAKINGRPAHVVVAERKTSGSLTVSKDDPNA